MFLVFRIRYKQNPRNYYYESIIERETLHQVQRMMNVNIETSFDTDAEIMFRNIPFKNDLYSFLKILGVPQYKIVTKYSDSKHRVLVYKNEFCGYHVKIVVNTLDDYVLSCAYHIDIESSEKLSQLKSIFKTKYQIQNTQTNNFLITDETGNKILFNYQFNAVITYINASPDLQLKIKNVFSNEYQLRELHKQKQLEKLQLAF